ncbi:MAG: dihydrofolate reductase [Bacteroidetes bacterium]|nr:MAG: dihydrofolate reductase [Bacteroidota bacterium]
MRKIIIYIASSLDGYIARKDGAIDWLPTEADEDYGYEAFLQGVDTVLMGNKTYQQVRGFDVEYPYKNFKNFVFTRNQDLSKDEYVDFIREEPASFMKTLKNQPSGNIWLIGGGEIINNATIQGVADELILFVMPVVLGEGLPLFLKSADDRKLELLNSKTYKSGVVELHYKFL